MNVASTHSKVHSKMWNVPLAQNNSVNSNTGSVAENDCGLFPILAVLSPERNNELLIIRMILEFMHGFHVIDINHN